MRLGLMVQELSDGRRAATGAASGRITWTAAAYASRGGSGGSVPAVEGLKHQMETRNAPAFLAHRSTRRVPTKWVDGLRCYSPSLQRRAEGTSRLINIRALAADF